MAARAAPLCAAGTPLEAARAAAGEVSGRERGHDHHPECQPVSMGRTGAHRRKLTRFVGSRPSTDPASDHHDPMGPGLEPLRVDGNVEGPPGRAGHHPAVNEHPDGHARGGAANTHTDRGTRRRSSRAAPLDGGPHGLHGRRGRRGRRRGRLWGPRPEEQPQRSWSPQSWPHRSFRPSRSTAPEAEAAPGTRSCSRLPGRCSRRRRPCPRRDVDHREEQVVVTRRVGRVDLQLRSPW